MSDSSALSKTCPKCGAALPSDATEGLCPNCLMLEAMDPTLISDAAKPKRSAILSPEELAPFFPAYEILRMLGRGGMGAVYLARQISLNRLVAIKLLPADMNEGEVNFAERFKNEAQAMALLNHPGIVAVHDFGQTANGLLFIVMEYVEGTDVQLMLASQGRLHSGHAMAITAHVCDALAYAHSRGIIHRDIKPSNIMVSNDGVVKVADFGLAKMSHGQTTGLTQSGMAMGTLHFMAPEALTLGTAVDQRADIYAMGVMLYQMLTGKLPQGMFEMPSYQVPGLDPRYDRIVAKALRDDREQRYQAAGELRHDLDAILTQPVQRAMPEAEEDVAALPPVEEREKKARPQRMLRVGKQMPTAIDEQVVQRRRGRGMRGWVAAALVILAAAAGAWLVFPKKTSPFADSPDPEGWHDLMRLIDPQRDAVNGMWAISNGELKCKPAAWALCEVPLKYTGGSYDYRISLTRGMGESLAVCFPFRKGDSAGDVMFDIAHPNFVTGRRSGLENVTGVNLGSPEEKVRNAGGMVVSRPQWLPRGEKCTVLIQVRDEGICVNLNGAEVWRWKGDWNWVTQSHGFEEQMFWKLNGRKIFGLGLYGCEATFHSIQMREVKGEAGRLLPPEASRTLNSEKELTKAEPTDPRPIPGVTKEKPFVNSLGMKFVPVPGTKVLMCVHETRRKDYAAYAQENPQADVQWKFPSWLGVAVDHQDDHPVVQVSWEDAHAFCEWLSQKEGRKYRMPKDHEWSCAVGIDALEPESLSPRSLNSRIKGMYPWGNEWPPPSGTGNYADVSAAGAFPGMQLISAYDDGHATTAPVMSFPPNKLGIFDLGGNAWEWCEDLYDAASTDRFRRGGSFADANMDSLLSCKRMHTTADERQGNEGFRCVMER